MFPQNRGLLIIRRPLDRQRAQSEDAAENRSDHQAQYGGGHGRAPGYAPRSTNAAFSGAPDICDG